MWVKKFLGSRTVDKMHRNKPNCTRFITTILELGGGKGKSLKLRKLGESWIFKTGVTGTKCRPRDFAAK